MDEWKEHYRVFLEPPVYQKVKGVARIREMSIEEWVNETLREAVREAPEAVEATLQAIKEAGDEKPPYLDC